MRENRDMLPFGVVHPYVEPLASFLTIGEVLDQEATGEGATIFGGRRRADQRRNLLASREIGFDRSRERIALERDHALIALAGRRQLEGDREVAGAEQVLKSRLLRKLGEALGIVPHVSAQLAVAIVADHQVDRAALGLGLQRELAFLALEQPAHQ